MLAHGSVKVVIYIGIGGVFGVLIGGLLVACGLLIWFHPVQRMFYAIAGVLLAVASFVATNLGGFFVGMLLGVTGASLSFGWTPGPGQPAGQHRPRGSRAKTPSGSLGQLFRDRGRAPAPRASAAAPRGTEPRGDAGPQEDAGPRGDAGPRESAADRADRVFREATTYPPGGAREADSEAGRLM